MTQKTHTSSNLRKNLKSLNRELLNKKRSLELDLMVSI